MKYEAVFGDQSLFDGSYDESVSIVIATSDGRKFVIGEFTEYGIVEGDIKSDGLRIAMRRIIAEPKRWTVEDQKAGRLPEVGSRVGFCHKLNTSWRAGEIKYIDDQVTVIKADDIDRPFVYEVDRVEFKPIETPEEKASRLRSEWCNEAGLVCSLGMTTLTRIYDALLSGELSTPSKDGE